MLRVRGITVVAALLVPAVLVPALAGCGADDRATPPSWVGSTPSSARSTVATSEAPAPSAPPSSAAPTPSGTYVFPVKGADVSYHPTHSAYPATDIFANCGARILAVTDGVILEVSRRDIYVKGSPDGPNNGGFFVSLLGDDGVRYYGSHARKVLDGIEAGVRVTAGQQLGEVGHTGNANNVCHLHFGVSPPCARTGDWKVRRGVLWPAPYLDSWRTGGTRNPVDEAAAWAKDHDCKA